jgi:general secretion pathway protein D
MSVPSNLVRVAGLCALALAGAVSLAAQETVPIREHGDSIAVQFVEADLRTVVQALAHYTAKPVLIAALPSVRVSFETPVPLARGQVLGVLRGLLESQNLDLVEDSAFYRVRPHPQEPPPRPAPGPGDPSARGAGGPVQLFVVRLRHARAADVAATVNLLFGGGGAFAGGAGLSSGTLSDELRRTNLAPASAQPAGAPLAISGGPAAATPGARPAALSGSVTIVPDEITNSLLVRASQADYEVLQQAIDGLDIRPLQVLIEVLIVEARTDRSFSLGVDLSAPQQTLHGDLSAAATLTGGGLGDLVIRVMKLGHGSVDATIRAAASRGDVKIISRPVLLASNNTEARLLVGSQRPFVQVSRSLPTETATRDQVVQYRDVGTKLTVRPTINYDGYVSLQIQQEVNAATSETQFDAPIISTREAATRVLVRDSQTIVIGGLRDLQRSATQGGIPLLSRIPILGGLFGSADRRTNETELYLFLTPRILRTDADADSVTVPRLRRQSDP